MHGGHWLLAAGMAAIVNHRIAGSDYLKGNDWLHVAFFDLGDISRRNPDERSEIRERPAGLNACPGFRCAHPGSLLVASLAGSADCWRRRI
jgi:hypothetical protein